MGTTKHTKTTKPVVPIVFLVSFVVLVFAVPASAQIFGKPTRPQVDPPKGPVRQVLFKNCT